MLSLVGPDASGQNVLFASSRTPILFVAESALLTSHRYLAIRSATKHPADSAEARLRGLFRRHERDYLRLALPRSSFPIRVYAASPFEQFGYDKSSMRPEYFHLQSVLPAREGFNLSLFMCGLSASLKQLVRCS